MPTLSVVIPAYNEEAVIATCLTAVFAQSEDLKEVIVVNNNSSDKTLDILKSLAKKHPKLIILTEMSPGMMAARNRGLNAATADLIGRIDADTYVKPDWAKSIRTFFAETANAQVGAATGPFDQYDAPFQKTAQFATDFFFNHANTSGGSTNHLYGANMVISRNGWNHIKAQVCSRHDIMEDLDISIHLANLGIGVGFIKRMKVSVSARRMLMNPMHYWRYQKFWPNTYKVHNMHKAYGRILAFAIFGALIQAVVWLPFKFYNPGSKKFELRYFFTQQEERVMPYYPAKR